MANVETSKKLDDEEHDQDDEDEDEEEDEENGGEMAGYLEDKPSASEKLLLTRRMFPSKVGGRPAWLVPKDLPELGCPKCSRPMRFLLQVYASRGSDKDEAFHRALHMFVCTNCQPNEVKVFRAQLPRINDYYSSEPPDEEQVAAEAHNDPELEALTCLDCGLPHKSVVEEGVEEVSTSGAVSGRCIECERRIRNKDGPATFEERELSNSEACLPDDDEDEDDDMPSHVKSSTAKQEDDTYAVGPELPGTGALEGADAAMANLQKSTEDSPEMNQELMAKLKEFQERAAVNSEEALDGSEQKVFDEWSNERGEKDKTFSRFQRYSAANEAHVMRYTWDGSPLWFCGVNKLSNEPPKCPHCGAARIFEYQVQPQLIAALQGTTQLAARLDYGTICVFVCAETCTAANGSTYLEEFAYVQPEPGDAWVPSG